MMDTDELIRAALDRAAGSAPSPIRVRARLTDLTRRRRQRRALLLAAASAAGVLVVAGTSAGLNWVNRTSGDATAAVPLPTCAAAVFLRTGVTAEQRGRIETELRRIPQAGPVTYHPHDQAYENFRIMFKDAPDLLASAAPEDTSAVFWVTVIDSAASMSHLDRTPALPGVALVVTTGCTTPLRRPASGGGDPGRRGPHRS